MKCSSNCLYCLDATSCIACSADTYLNNGVCNSICSTSQKYNGSTSQCQTYTGSSYSQEGRLGFDWSYTIQQNEIIIDLIFSQASMAYYYY